MSSAARLAFRGLRPSLMVQRTVQNTITKRHAHGHDVYDHFPFDSKNKKTFAIKCALYMGTGFSIPFIAIWWQWNKPGGIHNP